MPAKRRPSKFIKQAPQVKKPVGLEDSVDISLLSGDAEKLGNDLIKISKSGNVEKITKLLAHADAPIFVNQKDKLGWNALMCACKADHPETVTMLLNAGADFGVADNNGYSALMWASYKGNTDIVDILLKAGADVGHVNAGGWDALMLASLNNKKDALKQLIDAGADPMARNDSDRTALQIATDPHCKAYLQTLVDIAEAEEAQRQIALQEERERDQMQQEEAYEKDRLEAEAIEMERQRLLAEQEALAQLAAEEELRRREEEAAREAARARKKAEAEARALERVRRAAEKAARKEQRKVEMGEDYYSSEEEEVEPEPMERCEEELPTVEGPDNGGDMGEGHGAASTSSVGDIDENGHAAENGGQDLVGKALEDGSDPADGDIVEALLAKAQEDMTLENGDHHALAGEEQVDALPQEEDML